MYATSTRLGYEQSIKLRLVKANRVREDFIMFIPILERPSLFLYKQEQVLLYWPYSDISDATFYEGPQ